MIRPIPCPSIRSNLRVCPPGTSPDPSHPSDPTDSPPPASPPPKKNRGGCPPWPCASTRALMPPSSTHSTHSIHATPPPAPPISKTGKRRQASSVRSSAFRRSLPLATRSKNGGGVPQPAPGSSPTSRRALAKNRQLPTPIPHFPLRFPKNRGGCPLPRFASGIRACRRFELLPMENGARFHPSASPCGFGRSALFVLHAAVGPGRRGAGMERDDDCRHPHG